jgi:hypothetical protein
MRLLHQSYDFHEQGISIFELAVGFGIVLVLLCAPIFAVESPPLADLPNHLARLYVLSTGERDAVLSQFWRADWSGIPNLAIDLFGPLLIRASSVDVASRVIVVISVATQLLGAVLLHHSIFGRRSYWPLLASLVIYNHIFLLGFVNYCLGVGVAMIGASAWLSPNSVLRRLWAVTAIIFAAATFFCHVAAAAFYLVLIGSWQVANAWELRASRRGALQELVKPLLPALCIAVLYLEAPHAMHDFGWRSLWSKGAMLAAPFSGYYWRVDLIGILFAAVVGIYSLVRRALVLPMTPLVASIILFIIYFIAPSTDGGTANIDKRIPMLIIFVLVSGSEFVGRLAVRRDMLLGGLSVLLIRQAFMAIVWVQTQDELRAFRALGVDLFPGARVISTSVSPDDATTVCPKLRIVPKMEGYGFINKHWPAYWVIDRRIFWPGIFADRTQQPLKANPPYDQEIIPFNNDYRALIGQGDPIFGKLIGDWRSNYDFVVVITNGCSARLDEVPSLTLVGKIELASLYRVNKDVVPANR